MVLTVATLRQHHASENQIKAFELTFGPEGLDFSDLNRDPEIIEKALSTNFDLNWAVQNLLTPTAEKAYSEACATALLVGLWSKRN